MCLRIWLIVLPSVELYRQLYFTAVEIEHKTVDWVLSAKSKTCKLLASEIMP